LVVEDSTDIEREWREEEDGRDCSEMVVVTVVVTVVVVVVVVVAGGGRSFFAVILAWTLVLAT
jgi:hypothetical protein